MKALVITNNLLQLKSPACPIEMGLLDELQKKGVDVTAICSSMGELSEAPKSFKTIQVKENSQWLKLFKIGKKFAPDIFNIPDYHRFSWNKKAVKTAFTVLAEDNYDLIISISHPSSCHLIANELHQKTCIPWIATFFDSWTDYPMLKYRVPIFKNYNRHLERAVAQNASLIVHSNDNFAKLWSDRYGAGVAKKIVVIPFNESFHREYEGILSSENKDILHISHIGTFYPFRSAKAFIEGIRFFVETYPHLRDRIKVNFAGRTLDSDVSKIKEYKLTDVFNLMGVLSRKECEDVYSSSDVLLATAEQSFEDYTFPSKIIKYFYYQKPILGICRPSSVLYSELTGCGHQCVSPGYLKGIAEYLYQAVTNYQSICSFDKNHWKKFAVENVATQYLENLVKLLKK